MLKGRYEKEKSDRKKSEQGEKEDVEDMKSRTRVKMMMKRNDDEEDDEEPRRRKTEVRPDTLYSGAGHVRTRIRSAFPQ